MSTNLYDQMTELSRRMLAQRLGFNYAGDNDWGGAGFRITLREIHPIPCENFTLGQALDAYLAHMVACRAASAESEPKKPTPPDDAITALMDADWKLPARNALDDDSALAALER